MTEQIYWAVGVAGVEQEPHIQAHIYYHMAADSYQDIDLPKHQVAHEHQAAHEWILNPDQQIFKGIVSKGQTL